MPDLQYDRGWNPLHLRGAVAKKRAPLLSAPRRTQGDRGLAGAGCCQTAAGLKPSRVENERVAHNRDAAFGIWELQIFHLG